MFEIALWVLAIWAGFTVLAVALMVWAIRTAAEGDEDGGLKEPAPHPGEFDPR